MHILSNHSCSQTFAQSPTYVKIFAQAVAKSNNAQQRSSAPSPSSPSCRFPKFTTNSLPMPPSPVYVLAYSANNTAFNLCPLSSVLSIHRTEDAAISAGREFLLKLLEHQLSYFPPSHSTLEERIEEWHTGEWMDLDGAWKSMINAKCGGRDLVVSVKREEVVG